MCELLEEHVSDHACELMGGRVAVVDVRSLHWMWTSTRLRISMETLSVKTSFHTVGSS